MEDAAEEKAPTRAQQLAAQAKLLQRIRQTADPSGSGAIGFDTFQLVFAAVANGADGREDWNDHRRRGDVQEELMSLDFFIGHLVAAGGCGASNPVLARALARLEAAEGVCGRTQATEALRSVVADTSVASLGAEFASLPPDALVIGAVEPGSWAEAAGLRPGSTVVSVGCQDARRLSRSDFEDALRARPLRLAVELQAAQGEAGPRAEVDEEAVAEALANRGVSVRQLLSFCVEMMRKGKLHEYTTTSEVVRSIVIPETKSSSCCYMLSDFMLRLGGGKRAERLVAHAWQSCFLNTVLNIVYDATELGKVESARTLSGNAPNAEGYETNPLRSYYDMQKLLDHIANKMPEALERTYWLCIFAVNEHAAICGEPGRELDRFDRVLARMRGLVVSLDSGLAAVRRLGVAAAIGEAFKTMPVCFRIIKPLAWQQRRSLADFAALVPPLDECEAASAEDKCRLLERVDAGAGGRDQHCGIVNCLLEMSFGCCRRLGQLAGEAAAALAHIAHLEMDFTWRGSELRRLGDLTGPGSEFRKLQLRHLTVRCSECRELRDVAELSAALRTQEALEELHLDFHGCSSLADTTEEVSEAASGSGGRAGDGGCVTLCAAVAALRGLQRLELRFGQTRVGDSGLAALAQGWTPGLLELCLGLEACTKVGEAGLQALGAALPRGLRRLELALLGRLGFDGVGDANEAKARLAAQICERLGTGSKVETEKHSERYGVHKILAVAMASSPA